MSKPLDRTTKGATTGKPPVAPDLNQVLNSISLSMSKHRGLLASLSQHRPSSTASTSTTTASNKPKSGAFSTLLQQKSGSTTPSADQEKEGDEDEEKQRRVPDHEEEMRSILNQPPNAGLGWIPPKSENGFDKLAGGGGGSKEERELRRKMGLKWQPGQQGKQQQGQEGGLKRKKVEESESEEEVGRAGAIRGKRRGVGGLVSAADLERGKAVKGAAGRGRGAVPVPVSAAGSWSSGMLGENKAVADAIKVVKDGQAQDKEGGKPTPADKATTDDQHKPDASAVQETRPTTALTTPLPTKDTSKSEDEPGTAGTAAAGQSQQAAAAAAAAAKKKKENENRKKKKNKKKNRRKAAAQGEGEAGEAGGEGVPVDGKEETENGRGGDGKESE
ncbi:hypothetical protein QBC32DRAFT_407172 [Pseudoneurospora amorphoporcata]|uniref:Uncharacterized protein n=1 Tax=Pseudoneurospora amorphoporcata TaxID=241081 RepID=A0AAN6NRC9_9PEZI|nr:hypothetical protein QBC32DRAFT_407172 [Pseudoneurospora amorphoporcata]